MLKVFDHFEWEPKILDELNITTKLHSFWYDPEEFCKKIANKYNTIIKNQELIIKNQELIIKNQELKIKNQELELIKNQEL